MSKKRLTAVDIFRAIFSVASWAFVEGYVMAGGDIERVEEASLEFKAKLKDLIDE